MKIRSTLPVPFLKLAFIEKVGLIGILIALLAPLSANLGLFRLVTWNAPALLVVFVLLIRGIVNRNYRVLHPDLWEYSILTIGIIFMVTTLMGDNIEVAWPSLTQFLAMFALAVYVRRAWNRTITIQTLIKFAFAAIFVQSVIGILQQITFSEIGNIKAYFGELPTTMALRSPLEEEISRVHGTLGQANLVGNWLNVLFPFIFISSKYPNVFSRIKSIWLFQLITFIIGTVCIVFTISRANIAMFGGLVFFYLLIYLSSKNFSRAKLFIHYKKFIFVSIIFTASIIAVIMNIDKAMALEEVLNYRYSEINAEQTSISSLDFRLEMDKGAIEYFIKHPIIGLGYRNSRFIWSEVRAKIPESWHYQPHNVYLALAVEGGFFVLIAFLYFSIYPIFRLIKYRKTKDPGVYAFFIILMMNLAFSQVYLTPLTAEYGALYMLIYGAAMGYIDHLDSSPSKINIGRNQEK